MKKRFFKLLTLILALILIASAFSGCAKKRGKNDAPIYTSDKRVVMTVGGYNVTYDLYRYMFLNSKFEYDNGDETYWTQEGNDVEKVKDFAFDVIKRTYAIFALVDKYEISLSDQDLQDIKNYIEQSKEGYSEEDYQTDLKKSFLTEELYEYLLKAQQLEYLLYNYLIKEETGIIRVDDATLTKALENDFARATHILFTYSDETEAKSQLEKANSVLARLKNGEDFETLKEEFSDDTYLKNNTDGYYFTHGEFKNEFEYTAFRLNVGEISDVIETEVGYHIVKRLPIDDEYVNTNFEKLREQYITAKYYEILDETAKDFTPEFTDKYKNIDLHTFD